MRLGIILFYPLDKSSHEVAWVSSNHFKNDTTELKIFDSSKGQIKGLIIIFGGEGLGRFFGMDSLI